MELGTGAQVCFGVHEEFMGTEADQVVRTNLCRRYIIQKIFFNAQGSNV